MRSATTRLTGGHRRRERALAPIWKALSDATRRGILDLLRERPRTTGELATAFPSSRFAVMQHLAVLEESGLVVSRKRGRERWNHLNAVPLQRLHERWVRPYEALWARGLLRLKRDVEGGGGKRAMSDAIAEKGGLRAVELELEVPIEAPRDQVWSALVEEIALWWPKDFFAQPGSQRIVLEPHAGGRLYEEGDDGAQLLWSTVVLIAPPRTLELAGHLIPSFGGPATDMIRLTLEESPRGTTLRLSEVLFGRVSEKTTASLKKGWRRLFGEAFKRHAEARRRL